MNETLSSYAHLWDGTEDGWVVLKEPDGGYSAYNKKGFMLVIESDELNSLVCQRMIAAGCQVLDETPDGQALP